ncbi:MAG: NrsF family protein [Methylobacterium sp.]|uniref:NrsF family protein n=1 Tax=Methylobacterium sp. TaxID=409 RepID=UPI0025F64D9E|nr:NrsF family protein [Methylobacterium sp.]MBX9932968.1 NrsF family protein [Methylobacterium sp.]
MSEAGTRPDPPNHDALVNSLSERLSPVRRLPDPWLRGLGWFSLAVLAGLAALPFADMASLQVRMAVMDLRVATFGALLTALTAAVAAFQTSVPGRSAAWAFLPAAPAALWLGASGLGCLRQWTVPGTDLADGGEMGGCLVFLLTVSTPFSVALVLMLRRACPLRPNLTAALGGLAAAAAAAVLLVPFHPHDATVTDLLAHLVVIGLIIWANSVAGGRLLAGR